MDEQPDGWVVHTQAEIVALVKLRERLKDIEGELKYQNLNLKNSCLIRFLRFKKMKVDLAEKQIRDALVWFKEFDPEDIAERYIPPEAIKKYYTGGLCGHDKEGTPIFWDRLGQIDPKLVDHVTQKEVVLWEVQKTEIITRALEASSTPQREQYQMVNVMDLRGLGKKHWIKEGMDVLKEILTIVDNYYPERLKLMLIVNAPMIFSPIWRIIKYFVSPVTRARVKIVSGDPTKLLYKYIDEDQVPAYLGGKLSIEGDPNCCPPILKGGKVPDTFKGAPSGMREKGSPARTSFVLPPHVLEKLRNYSRANTRPEDWVEPEDGKHTIGKSKQPGSLRDLKIEELEKEYCASIVSNDAKEEKSFIEESVAATLEWVTNISDQLTSQAPDWSLLAWMRGDNQLEDDDDVNQYVPNTTPLKIDFPEEKPAQVQDVKKANSCGCCVIV